MSQQKLVWSGAPLSVYEWSKLDLGAMLHRRPIVELIDDHGQPMNISMVCQMPRLILADGASLSVQASEAGVVANDGRVLGHRRGQDDGQPPDARRKERGARGRWRLWECGARGMKTTTFTPAGRFICADRLQT